MSRVSVTLAQLESLVATVDGGSMTVAAERLHTTQSNLSVALSKLERQLGVELLVRHRSRGVEPTAAGREVAVRARAILQATQQVEEWSRNDGENFEGPVAVGCFLPLTSFYAPALLRALQIRAPGVAVSIQEAPMNVLHRRVLDAELDLALVYDQGLPPGLDFRSLARVNPYVIVAEDSVLAGRSAIGLAELTEHTMVTYDLPFTTERSHRFFESAGLSAPREVRATSIETVRALVAGGAGFAILNQRWATNVTADGAAVVTIELAAAVEPLRLGVVTRPATRSARVRLVGDLLAEHAARRHP